MANKFKASIDDIFEFDCATLEDSFEKSIARYDFPYRSGSLLEDMGQKAHVIKIRCFFLNEWYETHKSLINYLDRPGDHYELYHPKYGIIKGQIESMVVRHDERKETAEIDLTFVENLRGGIDTVFAPPVNSGTESAFDDGQDELTGELSDDIAEDLGEDAGTICTAEVDPDADSLLGQFTGLTLSARSYVVKVDRYLRKFKAALNEVTSPANSLVSTTTYASTLPGVIIGSIAAAVERYAILYGAATASPTRCLNSFLSGVSELEDSCSLFSKYTRIAKAQRAAVMAGSMYATDEKTYQAQKQAAKVNTFSPLGKPQKQSGALDTVYSITEIETSLALVRTALQEAIDGTRDMQSLKTMAAALTDHVVDIKKTRPPLKTVIIDNPMPLHLICLKYGLSYNEAEQLMTINRIENPNFVSGEITVYG